MKFKTTLFKVYVAIYNSVKSKKQKACETNVSNEHPVRPLLIKKNHLWLVNIICMISAHPLNTVFLHINYEI